MGRGGAGFKQHSVLQGSGRGRLHDLLTDFADLQLETHLGGEGVRVASLEGGRGLSCGRSQKKGKEAVVDLVDVYKLLTRRLLYLMEKSRVPETAA